MSTYHLTIQGNIEQYYETGILLHLAYYLQECLVDGTIDSYTAPKAYSFADGRRVIAYSIGRTDQHGRIGRWLEGPVDDFALCRGKVRRISGESLI